MHPNFLYCPDNLDNVVQAWGKTERTREETSEPLSGNGTHMKN